MNSASNETSVLMQCSALLLKSCSAGDQRSATASLAPATTLSKGAFTVGGGLDCLDRQMPAASLLILTWKETSDGNDRTEAVDIVDAACPAGF
jgi:hypothetical protein